jgi:hypothetical protein
MLINCWYKSCRGTRWHSWLRHCATNPQVTGSSSYEVYFFNWPNPSIRTIATASASNRNEYQESSWGVKAGRRVRLTNLPPSVSVWRHCACAEVCFLSRCLEAGCITSLLHCCGRVSRVFTDPLPSNALAFHVTIYIYCRFCRLWGKGDFIFRKQRCRPQQRRSPSRT